MNVPEGFDSGVLPMNHSNKVEQSIAESEEGRADQGEQPSGLDTPDTEQGTRVPGTGGCAQGNREHKEMTFM
jgi:RNA-directed DNA polymerase